MIILPQNQQSTNTLVKPTYKLYELFLSDYPLFMTNLETTFSLPDLSTNAKIAKLPILNEIIKHPSPIMALLRQFHEVDEEKHNETCLLILKQIIPYTPELETYEAFSYLKEIYLNIKFKKNKSNLEQKVKALWPMFLFAKYSTHLDYLLYHYPSSHIPFFFNKNIRKEHFIEINWENNEKEYEISQNILKNYCIEASDDEAKMKTLLFHTLH